MKNTTNQAEIPANEVDTSITIKLPTVGWGFHNNPLDEAHAAVIYSSYYLDAVLHFIGLGIAATAYQDKQDYIDRPRFELTAQTRQHFQLLIEIGQSINAEISEYMGAFDEARGIARNRAEAKNGERENLADHVSIFLNDETAPAEAKESLGRTLGEMMGTFGNDDFKDFPELVRILITHPNNQLYSKNLNQDLNGGK